MFQKIMKRMYKVSSSTAGKTDLDRVFSQIFSKVHEEYRPRAVAIALKVLGSPKVKTFLGLAAQGKGNGSVDISDITSSEKAYVESLVDKNTRDKGLDPQELHTLKDQFVDSFLEFEVIDRMDHIVDGILKNHQNLFNEDPDRGVKFLTLDKKATPDKINLVYVSLYGEPVKASSLVTENPFLGIAKKAVLER